MHATPSRRRSAVMRLKNSLSNVIAGAASPPALADVSNYYGEVTPPVRAAFSGGTEEELEAVESQDAQKNDGDATPVARSETSVEFCARMATQLRDGLRELAEVRQAAGATAAEASLASLEQRLLGLHADVVTHGERIRTLDQRGVPSQCPLSAAVRSKASPDRVPFAPRPVDAATLLTTPPGTAERTSMRERSPITPSYGENELAASRLQARWRGRTLRSSAIGRLVEEARQRTVAALELVQSEECYGERLRTLITGCVAPLQRHGVSESTLAHIFANVQVCERLLWSGLVSCALALSAPFSSRPIQRGHLLGLSTHATAHRDGGGGGGARCSSTCHACSRPSCATLPTPPPPRPLQWRPPSCSCSPRSRSSLYMSLAW